MSRRRSMGAGVIPGGVANHTLDLAPRSEVFERLAQRTVVGRFVDDVDAAREVLAMLGLDGRVVE